MIFLYMEIASSSSFLSVSIICFSVVPMKIGVG